MAITQITLNLGGDDKDLTVEHVGKLIQEVLDSAERKGTTPQLILDDGTGGWDRIDLDLDPNSYRVQRLGKETS